MSQVWLKASKGLLIVLMLGLAVSSGAGQGRTWTVCLAGPPTCNFASIRAALNAAQSGDTILIRAGNYRENPVIFTDRIAVRGEDPRTVRLEAAEPFHTLEVQAAGVTIEGLTIRGAGRGQFADFAGIYVVGSGAILKRVILQDNNVGVIVTSPPAEQPPAQILESTFTGNDKDIEVWSRALIRDNRFDDEVAVDIGGYAEIRKNKGTILRINGAALVEENRFMQVKVFSFSVPDLPTILRSNQIIGTGKGIEETGVFEEGLTIKAASPLTVEDNLISQHGGSAIVIDQSSAEILLRRNIITNSGYGLWLLRGFPQLVRVEGNTIERNLLGGVLLISEDEEAHFEVVDNLIRLNQGNGIMIGIAGRYLLQGNKILDNDYWGVIETIPPCVQEDLGLRPQVTGSGNEISGNGKKLPPEAKALGDGEGNVCPKELLSLKK